MNKPVHISHFLLERYHIGEITSEEKRYVENALAGNSALAVSLAELDRADRDFRERFPPERFFPGSRTQRRFRPAVLPVWQLSAAALVLIAVLPWLILRNYSARTEWADRAKGRAVTAELSVYLKENPAGTDVKLPDQAGIRMGNTIQLAYRVSAAASDASAASGDRYGVIFSIDGRSSVTMHYPYNAEQSTRLVSEKIVPLEEAYTLDDAPDYEIFFFVVGDEPLEVQRVLSSARQLALRIAGNPQKAVQQGNAVFKDYEVQVVTLRKE